MRTQTIAVAILAFTSGPSLGEDARYKHFDKNSDGKLGAEEFPYPVVFKQLDLDGDGSL